MKQEIEIEIPKDWSAVTLRKYLEMNKDMETYSDNEQAIKAVMLYHLCGVKVEWLERIDIDAFIHITKQLNTFLSQSELPLQRLITIGGELYGFEPNLSKMPYGAYVDISSYDEIGINDKWAHIMSILYRRVVVKTGELYDIEPYTAGDNSDKFLDLGMDIHLGALFFLRNLQMDLLKGIQKYLMAELEEIPHSIKSILEKNGNLTHPLSHYQQIISSYLTKLKENH
jgi:hypothetical protein